jgi:hypothetical protein
MSLGTELAAAVASLTSDAAYLRAIVQGPASAANPASLVALPNGALIKSLARIAQEVTGGYLPLAGGTLTGALLFGNTVSLPGAGDLLRLYSDGAGKVNGLSTSSGQFDLRSVDTFAFYNGTTTPRLLLKLSHLEAAFKQRVEIVAAGVRALRVIGDDFVESQIVSARDSASDHAMINGYASRGTTAVPTALINGDRILTQGAAAYDGAVYQTVAQMVVQVDGTVSEGSVPTSILFATAPSGFASPLLTLSLRSNGAVRVPRIGTTGSASNAYIDAGDGNSILRSTSSIIYKDVLGDLPDAEADAVVDGARPKLYHSKSPHDDASRVFVGLIAEDEEANEPRLVTRGYQEHHYEMVEVEAAKDGKPARMERRLKADAVMVPDGLDYARYVCHLLSSTRRLRVRVAELEADRATKDAMIADLAVRVATLEAAAA